MAASQRGGRSKSYGLRLINDPVRVRQPSASFAGERLARDAAAGMLRLLLSMTIRGPVRTITCVAYQPRYASSSTIALSLCASRKPGNSSRLQLSITVASGVVDV